MSIQIWTTGQCTHSSWCLSEFQQAGQKFSLTFYTATFCLASRTVRPLISAPTSDTCASLYSINPVGLSGYVLHARSERSTGHLSSLLPTPSTSSWQGPYITSSHLFTRVSKEYEWILWELCSSYLLLKDQDNSKGKNPPYQDLHILWIEEDSLKTTSLTTVTLAQLPSDTRIIGTRVNSIIYVCLLWMIHYFILLSRAYIGLS